MWGGGLDVGRGISKSVILRGVPRFPVLSRCPVFHQNACVFQPTVGRAAAFNSQGVELLIGQSGSKDFSLMAPDLSSVMPLF